MKVNYISRKCFIHVPILWHLFSSFPLLFLGCRNKSLMKDRKLDKEKHRKGKCAQGLMQGLSFVCIDYDNWKVLAFVLLSLRLFCLSAGPDVRIMFSRFIGFLLKLLSQKRAPETGSMAPSQASCLGKLVDTSVQ